VFQYDLDWEFIKQQEILPLKLKGWISKQCTKHFGESDANDGNNDAIRDYIFGKVVNVSEGKLTTAEMVDKLESFFDEETQKFCIKMWRCLVLYYETSKNDITR
jgi:hypothetical protein